MNMKKKLVTVCLVACMAVTAVAGGTLAYFTDTKEATNTFTVGDVEITLNEDNWDGENAKLVPHATIKKDPSVTLTSGSENAWVFVELEIGEGLKSMMEATKPEALNFSEQFAAWVKNEENVGVDADWELVKEDGNKLIYRYTDAAIEPGKTDALFDTVVVPDGLTAEMVDDATGDKTIKVTAKAIQSEGVNADTAFTELFPAYKA